MKKVLEVHSGQEAMSMRSAEDVILDKITVERLLAELTPKERETIWLWATRHTALEIASYLTIVYDDKDEGQPLSPAGVGARIQKILDKLRSLVKDQ